MQCSLRTSTERLNTPALLKEEQSVEDDIPQGGWLTLDINCHYGTNVYMANF